MQKKLAPLALATSLLALTGCGDGAEPQSALEDAIRQVEIAQQGYAPAQGDQVVPLDQHQRERLAEATRKLQEVLDGGTPAQQVAARQLLAQIQVSQARTAAQEAAEAYARIAPRAVALLDFAIAAETADARVTLLDERRPAVIEALRSEIGSQQGRQQELQAQASELQSQMQTAQGELEQIHARRDEAAGRAQQFRDQAFVAEGDEQYGLYNRASTAERESTVAAAEGDRVQLSLDMLQSQRAVIDSQLELTNDLIQELQGRVQAAQQRQTEVEAGMAQATGLRDEQVQQLTAALEEVAGTFRQDVDQRLTRATAQLGDAVQHLEAAQGQAQGPIRQTVQQDLLGARAAQASLYAEHLLVVAGFQDVLRTLQQAVSSLEGVQVAGLGELTQALAQQESELAGQARQAIQSGQELATQLGDETQAARLTQYAQRVGAVSTQ